MQIYATNFKLFFVLTSKLLGDRIFEVCNFVKCIGLFTMKKGISQHMLKLVVFLEPSYAKTPWYHEMMRGLQNKLFRHPISILPINTPPTSMDSDVGLILLAGETAGWRDSMIEFAVRFRIRVCTVVSGFTRHTPGISSISLNREKDMHLLVCYFYHAGRKKIALWGINDTSPTDRMSITSFLYTSQLLGLPLSRNDIYVNYKNAKECAHRLLRNIHKYDGIIAGNGLYAAYILNFLKNHGFQIPERLFLATFSNDKLSILSQPAITVAAIDYYELGCQAATAAEYLLSNPNVMSLSIELTSHLLVRASTADTPFRHNISPSLLDIAKKQYSSYDDPSITQLSGLELVLNDTDPLTKKILANITYPDSLSILADRLFISESTLNYRLHKIYKEIGISSRRELCALLDAYAPLLKKVSSSQPSDTDS